MTALVVGLGTAGRRHARALKACCPDLRVVGVSRSMDRAVAVDETVGSIDAALDYGPSFAVLSGPASTRIATAVRLAREGIHLLLEKPIGVSLDGVASLASLAAAQALTVAVGYNLRFFEPLRIAKDMIDEGAIGPIYGARAEVGQYLPEWRPGGDYRASVSARSDLGGGVVLELSHEIDYMAWIIGDPVAVTASLGRLGSLDIDVEDTAELTVTFASGVLASIHQDMLQRPAFRRGRFYGPLGSLEVDLIHGDVTMRTDADRVGRSVSVPECDLGATYVAQIDDFLQAMSSRRPPRVSLEDGIRTLKVAMAAKLSASAKRHVLIDEVDAEPGKMA